METEKAEKKVNNEKEKKEGIRVLTKIHTHTHTRGESLASYYVAKSCE